MKYRVWWTPQIPGKQFFTEVASVAEGRKLLDVLAAYDLFQLENRIKPDFCNAGGLQVFDPEDDTDSPDGSWSDWEDEDEELLHAMEEIDEAPCSDSKLDLAIRLTKESVAAIRDFAATTDDYEEQEDFEAYADEIEWTLTDGMELYARLREPKTKP